VTCQGKGTESWDCATCECSGQVSLREYEEIIARRREAEDEEARARRTELSDKQQKEQDATSRELLALSERLARVKDDLMQLGMAQGALLSTDSDYAVDRSRIVKTHAEQRQALRRHRSQCLFCGEPLDWGERLRRLPVHDRKDCKEGWMRVTKQNAESDSRLEEIVLEQANQEQGEA